MHIEKRVIDAFSREKSIYIYSGGLGVILLIVGILIGDGELSKEEISFILTGIGVSVIAAVVISYISMSESKNRSQELIKIDSLLSQCNKYGLDKIYTRRGNISSDEIIRFVSDAKRKIGILTVANQEWMKDQRVSEIFKDKVGKEKLSFKLVIVKPRSELANMWDEKEGSTDAVSQAAEYTLTRLNDLKELISHDDQGIKVLSSPSLTPFSSIIMADDVLYVTNYLGCQDSGENCPTFRIQSGELSKIYSNELDYFFDKAASI